MHPPRVARGIQDSARYALAAPPQAGTDAGVREGGSRAREGLAPSMRSRPAIRSTSPGVVHIKDTPSGKDKWDTPEVKMGGNKKGRMRKDRYSALLMSNMGARQLMHIKKYDLTTELGGFVDSNKKSVEGDLYSGPDWYTSQMQGVYD